MASTFGKGLKVLIVDDEASIRYVLREILADVGFEVDLAETVASALEQWEPGRYDLVLTDKNLPDGTGLDIARKVTDESSQCEVMVMSGFANVESAVESIRLRVADYLVKPFENLDEVVERVRRVIGFLLLRRENYALINELQEKNMQLQELVVRDGLTGLFNHAYFQERLANEITRSSRHGHRFGLVFIDVDRFKDINDGLGHQIGDRVLADIAEILRGGSRLSDDAFRLREHDIAARYGGDEFVLILPETQRAGAATKAERLRAFVEQTSFEGVAHPVTFSIGVACFPDDGANRADLIEAADTALYASKRLGRNKVMSYTPDLAPPTAGSEAADGLREKQLLALERTISEQSVTAAFQPVVDSRSWRIHGYEALCLPSDSNFSSSRELIRAAERSGQMGALGRLVRGAAMAAIEKLDEAYLLFVNLHPLELCDLDLDGEDSTLGAWKQRVVLQITEVAAFADGKRIRGKIEDIRKKGFRIALSEMHSGYTGMETLLELKSDYVRIDGKLLARTPGDPRATRLVRHLLEHLEAEKILGIAEGIDSKELCSIALDFGCPLLQGSYFGEAAPPFAAVEMPSELVKSGE